MPCTPGGGGAPTTARPYHCWTRRPVVEVISDCDQAGLQGAKGREDRPRGPASRWFLVRPISATCVCGGHAQLHLQKSTQARPLV